MRETQTVNHLPHEYAILFRCVSEQKTGSLTACVVLMPSSWPPDPHQVI